MFLNTLEPFWFDKKDRQKKKRYIIDQKDRKKRQIIDKKDKNLVYALLNLVVIIFLQYYTGIQFAKLGACSVFSVLFYMKTESLVLFHLFLGCWSSNAK